MYIWYDPGSLPSGSSNLPDSFLSVQLPSQDMISLGSILVVTAYLIQVIIFGQNGMLQVASSDRIEFYIVSACFTGMALWRHRANIGRLLNGTENKFGMKKK